MMTPTLHLNGTSRGDLHTNYMEALLAVEEAIQKIRATYPHGRDYYPQGEEAIRVAQEEHAQRLEYLKVIKQDLEQLCLVTMPK